MDPQLLRRVLESPADDGPRLMLADWLEESGHTLRAEFVRLQVELARTPLRRKRGNETSDYARHTEVANVDPLRERLERREIEMVAEVRELLLGEMLEGKFPNYAMSGMVIGVATPNNFPIHGPATATASWRTTTSTTGGTLRTTPSTCPLSRANKPENSQRR